MTRHIIAPDWIVKGYEFPADVQVTQSVDLGELDQELMATADFVVLPYDGSSISVSETILRLPNVKVLQTLTAGFDNVQPFVPAGVTLCNAAGVHDDDACHPASGHQHDCRAT